MIRIYIHEVSHDELNVTLHRSRTKTPCSPAQPCLPCPAQPSPACPPVQQFNAVCITACTVLCGQVQYMAAFHSVQFAQHSTPLHSTAPDCAAPER